MANLRFHIRTYGCQMNERDSEALACLLESNQKVDDLPVRIIPFDDETPLTNALAEAYGACMVQIDPKWDRLGKSLYGEKEYRPGIPSWRYFRKLNALDGEAKPILFADSNVVMLNSLGMIFDMLADVDLAFGDRARKGRNFPPWATQIINIIHPGLADGFNASFWITRRDLLNGLDIEALINRPGFRVMLGKAPEQSFLQLAAILLGKRIGGIADLDPDSPAQ